MALIECSDCGKTISDQSSVCIGCGRPIQTEEKKIISIVTTISPKQDYIKASLIFASGLVINFATSINFYKNFDSSGLTPNGRGIFLFIVEQGGTVFLTMLTISLIVFPIFLTIKLITKKWPSLSTYAVTISIIEYIIILFASYAVRGN